VSALQWRAWSCTVRIVLDDGRPAEQPPAGETADLVADIVKGLMRDVDASASRFRPDSDVEVVNARAGLVVPVHPLTLRLVDAALSAAADTHGACDPTVGAHVMAAGYDTDIDEVRRRDGSAVSAVPPAVAADWTAVRMDRTLGRVGVPTGLRLDLGATAKAWTADEAAARVHESLGMPALVALGGDVAVAGRGPAWPVVVSEHEGEPGQVVSVAQGGLATSSTRGRRWATSAGESHHVIDPRSGVPAAGYFRTVSVLAGSCLTANALATAAVVWGEEAPERLGGHAARLVRHDGLVVTTGAWVQKVAA
jgi:FAD:protein FMN transferase